MFKELLIAGCGGSWAQQDVILSVNGHPQCGMGLSLWEHSL